MAVDTISNDAFSHAIAQCQGDLSVALFSTLFSIGVNSVFLLISIPCLLSFFQKPTIHRTPTALLVSNLILGVTFAALNSCLLALAVLQPGRLTQCSLVSSVLNCISAWFALVLSLYGHLKSQRPPSLLCSFLFLTLLSNTTKCQELWVALQDNEDRKYVVVYTASIVAELSFLLTNSIRRKSWMCWDSSVHSPEESSGIFGLALYSWLNDLILMGYRHILALEDLYPLDQDISLDIAGKTAPRPRSLEMHHSNMSILKWVVKPLVWPILLPVLPRLCLTAFTFCQPLFVQRLLDFLAQGGAEASQTTATGLIGSAILIYVGIAVSTSLYWYYVERAQSKLRAFLVTSIYQKTTEARCTDGTAAVTLMSTDVDRIYTGVRNIHDIWASIIQVALSLWLLQRQLGLAFISPLVVVLLSFAGSFTLSKLAVKYQQIWMGAIQKRIAVTGSVLSRIKELRISGLTKPVIDHVQALRIDDIHHGTKSRTITATAATLSQIPQAIVPVVAFAFGPHLLDPTKAFTSLSYLTLLTSPLLTVLQVIPIVASCLACLRRIHEFISAPPREDIRVMRKQMNMKTGEEASNEKQSGDAIILRSCSFGWRHPEVVLKDINISIPRSSVTFVIGPVASGKSTLLKAFLGEVPHAQGNVTFNINMRKVSYCDQVPFLLNASIAENIVAFSTFDAIRYNEVISATMLQSDINTFPKGDRTKIGSKGASLSGGQRQRVSLARALYHDAELLVLDDVLTGLDTKTQEQVCKRVLGPEGLLRKRRSTVVVCTQSTRFLSMADHVVVLSSDGTVAKDGDLADIGADERYSHLLSPSISRHQTDNVDISTSEISRDSSTEAESRTLTPSPATKQPVSDEQTLVSPPATDLSVYLHYISSIGIPALGFYAILIVGIGFCSNFPAIWLNFWSADSIKPDPGHTFAFYISIYALLGGASLALILGVGLLVLRAFVRMSGTQLHKAALDTAMHTSLRLLSTTDTGAVLNLFSQDMTIIDSQLPRMVNNLCICSAMALGQAVVIAVSSGYLAISYPFVLAVLYLVQKFYLPTSKQLRILDLEAKTPLYTHFLDTLNGIVTFRAFSWFPHQVARNKEILDMSQRPSYLLAMVQQWLLLVMNIIVAILATVLVSLATQLQGANLGSIGAGLVMLITFGGTLTTVLNAYTGLEISLGGISRLKTFGEKTEREDKPGEDIVPSEEWPLNGSIVMRDVSASYSNDPKASVLSDLSFAIEPRDKVALCGRTGSGKSSIVALLLRLLDPLPSAQPSSSPPSILIDDTLLEKIDRTALRTRLIAISQDAVFLPEGNSFRANLDPWGNASADEASLALEAVGLHGVVAQRGGIDAVMNEAEFSAGEKQLFALGRAVLRRRARAKRFAEKGLPEGGILLLDEMTASVDKDVEQKMTDIVKYEFEAYTVVTVTHSVEMAKECNRVIVMDKGRVVEDGDPQELAKVEGTWFSAFIAAGNR